MPVNNISKIRDGVQLHFFAMNFFEMVFFLIFWQFSLNTGAVKPVSRNTFRQSVLVRHRGQLSVILVDKFQVCSAKR